MKLTIPLPLAGLLVAAASATAAPQRADDGVMAFPHVSVEAQAPAARTAPARPVARDDVIAYRDQTTGRMVSPTRDQAAALSALRPPLQVALPPTVQRTQHGGVSARLPERYDRNMNALKDGDGKVTTSCEGDGHED